MAKKKKLGCLGTLVLMVILSGLVLFAGLSVVGYYGYKVYSNPMQFIKEYESLVKYLSDSVVSNLSSSKPMQLAPAEFDTDAYNSFIQKAGEFQKIINDPNARNVPILLEYSEREVMAGIKQDMAAYDIQQYKLEFAPSQVHIMASVPGEVLTPHIPKDLPEVFVKSLQTIEYLNLDLLADFEYKGRITKLNIQKARVGSLNLSSYFLEQLNLQLGQKKAQIAAVIEKEFQKNQVRPDEVVCSQDSIVFKGVWNP